MNDIKMYVIRDAKYPQWYFQHIKDYSRSYCRKLGKSRKGGEGNWLKMNLKS